MLDREIKRRLDKLEALEAGGVDNWDGYSDSLEEWHKEGVVDDAVEDTLEKISDLMVEADVEEPAGRGCGYSIDYDGEALRKLLYTLIKDVTDC